MNCDPKTGRIDSYVDNSPGHEPLPFMTLESTHSRLSSPAHESRRANTVSPFMTTTYYNYLERDIVITERGGSPVLVPPMGRYNGEEVIICKTASMTRPAMQRALDALRSRPSTDDRETVLWIRAYESALETQRLNLLTASVEYILDYRSLVDASGRCYMADLDLLVEWASAQGAIHPFDKVKRAEAVLDAVHPGISESSFVLVIKAVDNAPNVRRSNRFINVGGDVYLVPVERDMRYETGVHILTRSPITDEGRDDTVVHRSYTFEEADKIFGMHRTIEDARNGGPITDMAKFLLERDSINKRLKESEFRTGQLDVEMQLQRMRNEAAIEKAKNDYRSVFRRDWLDWLKTGVAALGAIVTFYGVLSKLKTT